MGNGKWFRRSGRRAKGGVQQPGQSAKRKGWLSSAANRCALSFEALEDRHMLATFLVTNTADVDGGGATIFGSLRWAIGQANGNADFDTIVFSENLFNVGGQSVSRTIGLNGGVLNITQQVEILGPGPRKLAISQGTAESRVFDLNIGSDLQVRSVEISGVTISGGRAVGENEAGKGGGIFNREALIMNEVVIQANSAQTGGGGVYTAFGGLTLNRSLVINNSSGGDGGGGILNGRPEAMNAPTTNINNSTIANNSAGRWGGGVFNRNGTLIIEHATITANTSGEEGDGVASYGNGVGPAPTDPPADPPPDHPDPTVFTEVYSSIIFGNGGSMGSDFDRVGETMEDPARRLNPSVVSRGYNLVGTGNTTMIDADPPIPPETDPMSDFAFKEPGDQVIPDRMTKVFRTDAMGMPLGRQDFGGSTDVYLLDETSPAIDAGDPEYLGPLLDFEQRGRHFTRVYDYLPDPPMGAKGPIDIGAVEMQLGVFVVDTLIDEDDFSYSQIYKLEFVAGQPEFTFGNNGYASFGDFSLREAIDFATKNPGLDTIQFSTELNSIDLVEEEDLNASLAPTIILKLGTLQIIEDLVIQGPDGFILEIDSVGLDSNPNAQNGTGSRAFIIDDGDGSLFSTVTMSNLTIMGGDVVSQGGGIFSREDLSLSNMTFKGNNATQDGGALYLFGGAIVTVNNSTFNNNRAANNGGAIYVTSGSDLTVTSSTFSSNLAGNRGGAMYVNGSVALVEYSTITLNNASSTLGSGIGVQGSTSSVEVKSSIISGNVSNDVDFFGSTASAAFASLGFNLIGRGTASGAFSAGMGDKKNILNPLLEALAVNGGLVATHAPTYRPDEGVISPVIDMGDPAAQPGLGGVPDYDQRGPGFTRVFDVLGNGPIIDIGAYELQGAVFEVSTLDDENDGVVSPGNMSLREAIALANLNPLFDVITFDAMILATNEPTIFLGTGFLAPGTPADIRITSSMKIDWQGDTQLLISGFALDNPSLSIIGSRMFTVDDGDLTRKIDVEFSGNNTVIQFYNARSSQGGGVFYSRENLKFNDVYFFNNQTYDPDETTLQLPAVDQTGLHGGALYQDGTGQAVKPTLTIERGIFTGSSTNDVDADGGAIYVVNAALILDDATVAGNSTTMADSDGGAIALKNSTLLSQGFTSITGNIIQAGAGDGGGVYFSDGSVVTLLDTVVSGNNTTGGNSVGGGLAGVNSQLIVNRSIINENFTLGTQSSGGGLAMTGGSAVLDASTLRANLVNGNNSHGGGIWNNGGLLTVRGSSIVDNDATHATGKGGGVYSDTNLAGTQSTLIVNSTISGNTADLRGGGVFNADGRTDIRNSTVTNNSTTAASAGAGVASFGNVATTVTSVQNSIIAGNVATDVSFVDGVSNSFQSLGYNVIGAGNAVGTFSQAGDQGGVLAPGLAPLADNGRPVGVAFEMLTHELLAGSVAINTGDPAFNTASLPEDQRGAVRKQKGRIDVGALESNFGASGFADFDGDSDVDGADFLTWQRNLGRTSATLAQGDANGDGSVNAADLTAWRNTFGSGSAVSAAAGSSSGAAFASAGVESAPAESDQPTATNTNGFASLASLGVPGSLASSAVAGKVSESREAFEAGDEASSTPALAWDSADGDSPLDDEGDFASLVGAIEGDSEGAAEDAVFAAWGVGRLF